MELDPARANPQDLQGGPVNKAVLQSVAEPHTELETHREEPPLNTKAVLQELYILLEDYAPVWYTQQHHDRALRVLMQLDS